MKELRRIAGNIVMSVVDDKLFPMVEIVLTLTEPVYHCDAGGDLTTARAAETIRFHATPVSLRLLSDWADRADKAAEQMAAGEIALVPQDDRT